MPREPKIINLPKNEESRGYLTYIEKDLHIPFSIEETNILYNIPESIKEFQPRTDDKDEFIIPLSGSAEVKLKTDLFEKTYLLNEAYQGLFVPAGMIKTIFNLSSNAVILKLKSKKISGINKPKIQQK